MALIVQKYGGTSVATHGLPFWAKVALAVAAIGLLLLIL